MFRHPISFLAGVAVGAFAMRQLERSGSAQRGAGVPRQRAYGAMAAGSGLGDFSGGTRGTDRRAMAPAADDVQLHERVRSRLGRLVRHPRLVHVEVREGVVWLAGHAMRGEVDMLVAQLGQVPGVRQVREGLQVHERDEEMANLPAQSGPTPRPEGSTEGMLH